MKIVDLTSHATPQTLYEICGVEPTTAYHLKISFSDGVVKVVDFQPFLSAATHPAIRKYLDQGMFAQFHLHNGLLMWNDYDLVFPIEDLHNGNVC